MLLNFFDKYKKFFYISIISITIGVYIYFLVRYSVNIPYSDDFPSILLRFNDFSNIGNRKQYILHFFSFNNEHRVIWNNVVQYIVYHISWIINFKTLLYIGNFALIFILLFFWKAIKANKKLFVFMLIVLLLINLRFWETTFSTMTALSNFWVIVFSLWAIYFSVKEWYKSFIATILFALLAFWCQWNGMLIFPVLILTYLFTKQKKYAYITLTIAIVLIWLYFIWYQEPLGLPSKTENIVAFITHPKYRLYPFIFLGNIAWVPSYYFTTFFDVHNLPRFLTAIPSLIIWFSSFGYMIYIFAKKRYHTTNILLSVVIFYIFINAWMAWLARLNGWFDTMMEARYSFYSLMWLSCILISFYEILWNKLKRIKRINIIFFVFFTLMNIWFTVFVYNFWLKTNIQQRIESMKHYEKSWQYIWIVHPDIIIEERVLELWSNILNQENVRQQISMGNVRYTEILDMAIKNWYYDIFQ